MAKKEYSKPQVDFIKFDFEDFIVTSGEFCIPDEPGHGHGHAWGYDNGNHNGHGKGHNPHDHP